MRLLGLDLSDLDTEHAQIYEQRRLLNQQLRDAQGALAELPPPHADVPDDEVSVSRLLDEKERLDAQLDANEAERAMLEAMCCAAETAAQNITETEERIAMLKLQLDAAKQMLAKQHTQHVALAEEHDAKLDEVAALVDPDIDALKRQIAGAEETNRKVRQNQARATHAGKVAQLRTASDKLTLKLNANRAARQKRIAAADFPVPGLGFGDDGPVLNGIPLHQTSHTEQQEVSAAVMAAANPGIKVFCIPDASTLDAEGLAFMAELAERHDCQLWEEDGRTTDPAAIIIEDGHVQGADVDELQQAE